MSPENALEWVRVEFENGVRLVCIEGLMQAGKSCFSNRLGSALGCRVIELDRFVPKDADRAISWLHHVLHSGAEAAVESALNQSFEPLVVEGVVAWPVVRPAAEIVGRDKVRRIYVKRISTQGGITDWWDRASLEEDARSYPDNYFRTVYQYHCKKPWERCDTVVERETD